MSQRGLQVAGVSADGPWLEGRALPSSISLSLFLTLTFADQQGLAPPPLAGESPSAQRAPRETRPPEATAPPEAAPVSAAAAIMAEPAEPGAPAPAGNRYAGLSLAPEAKNPLPTPKEEPPRLMWTGFTPTATGGEIFLQTSRGVVHDVAVTSGEDKGTGKQTGKPTVSVFLRNCRIHWKNNARRIDTRFFATAVAGVVARQRKRDVEVLLTLKQPAVPVVRTNVGPDGTQVIVLSFPPGERAPASEPGAGTTSAMVLPSASGR
jgi:hypothetical protein